MHVERRGEKKVRDSRGDKMGGMMDPKSIKGRRWLATAGQAVGERSEVEIMQMRVVRVVNSLGAAAGRSDGDAG